jgi:hypothetical protein
MRFREIVKETTERAVQQAVYMEGRCSVLAIAIHQSNPQRYKLGYVYEYNSPGTQDIYLDPEEFNALDTTEQQDIKFNHQNWGLVHAYVFDVKTKEYIDATGRHSSVPALGYGLNLTRKNVFPAEPMDIMRLSTDMTWDDDRDEWKVVRGIDAYLKIGNGLDSQEALDYAVKHLGVEPIDQAKD